jgi:hypothetical protein
MVTAEETWVHHYGSEYKSQSVEYQHRNSPSKSKSRTQASVEKLMAAVFLDASGVIHVDFLEPGTTVISDRYIATLVTLKQRLKRIRRKKEKVLLQFDNAGPHASSATVEGTESLNLAILLHLLCSPDLAPCKFNSVQN